MSFNVTDMEAYVSQNAKEIATKAITEAQTMKLLLANKSVQFGKGTQALASMSQSVTFTDGTTCGRIEDADVALSDRRITFVPLKNQKSFCFKDLYNTVLVELISKGQNEESMDGAIYGAIAEQRANLIAYEVEKLLWRGDTTLTNNLKWFDGFAKHIATSGTSITPTGSDIIEKLQSVAEGVDITIRSQDDFRVFMGKDTYNSLQLAMFNGKYFNPGAEGEIPGTGVKIEIVSGLNGVGKVYATRISNLRAIVDNTGEETNVVMKYDPLKNLAIMDFYFGAGVQVVFPDQSYYATV